ncbi:MAG TPA: MFS transporter [Mycobacteriales bacterium]|nr:MFS transporter [Mycobacteriales bacterium]
MAVTPRSAAPLVVYAFTVTMLGTTLPTPLYPAYETRFGFGGLTVTVVFAMYAVGVLSSLVGFGSASDRIGRRPSLLAGLGCAAVSSGIFVVTAGLHGHTPGLVLLLVGRYLSGLSAGVFTGTATATLSDLAGDEHKTRASLVAALANVGGLGLGPFVAGALAKYVAAPLTTPYAVHLGLVALAAVALLAIPETVDVAGPRRLRFQRLGVPSDIRATFVQAGTAGFAGFAVLGFFTAISAATLALLGHHDPLLTGAVVLAVFGASAVGQALSLRLATRSALLTGTAGLIVGSATVGAAIGVKSLGTLLAGGIVAGAAQGLSFRSALGEVTGAAPPDRRAQVSSSFFAVCYVGISLPVVGIGAATKAYGLVRTGEVFGGIVAAIAATALVALARSTRPGGG